MPLPGSAVHFLCFVFAVSLLQIPSGVSAESTTETHWVFETVDADHVQEGAVLALTEADELKGMYIGNGTTKYASLSEGSWSIQTVDSMMYSWGSSLAFDSNDNPYIFYNSNYYDGTVKYQTSSNGTWKMYTVDEINEDRGELAAGIDSGGHIHLVYVSTYIIWGESYGRTAGSLIHLTNENGNWSNETIENNTEMPTSISMVIDAEDKIHITFVSTPIDFSTWSVNSTLWYGSNAKGHWETSLVDGLGYNSYDFSTGGPDLVLDPEGHDHICYARTASDPAHNVNVTLLYANNSGGSWKNSTIDRSFRLAASASLALDQEGLPHVSYTDKHNSDPMYASFTGSEWRIERLQSVGISGFDPSLVIDASGIPHILFEDRTGANSFNSGGALVYATLEEKAESDSSSDVAYILIAASALAVIAAALILWRVRW